MMRPDHQNKMDLDGFMQGVIHEANARKNAMSTDGWGLEEEPKSAPFPAPVRHRTASWIGVVGLMAIILLGAGIVIGGSFLHRGPQAATTSQLGSKGEFVVVDRTSAPATSPAPGNQVAAPVPALAGPSAQEPIQSDSQLPLATAARRTLGQSQPLAPLKLAAATPARAESQPAPKGKPGHDDDAASPEALLGLAGQDNAPVEKSDKKSASLKSPPVAAAPSVPAPAPAAPAVTEETKPAATLETLPGTLSRSAINRGFSKVRARVAACKDKAPSDATMVSVTAVVTREGSVEEVDLEGPVASSDAAACIKSAVRAAQFDAFTGEPMTVSYPFSLK